jgi:hypothetical protein
MPAPPYQRLHLRTDPLRKLRPEVFVCELDRHFSERQLSVASVFGDDLVEHDSEGVDICRFLRFEDYVISIFEVFDGRIHCLVGIASNEGQIFFHRMQPAAVQQNLVALEEHMAWRNAAVHDLVVV